MSNDKVPNVSITKSQQIFEMGPILSDAQIQAPLEILNNPATSVIIYCSDTACNVSLKFLDGLRFILIHISFESTTKINVRGLRSGEYRDDVWGVLRATSLFPNLF